MPTPSGAASRTYPLRPRPGKQRLVVSVSEELKSRPSTSTTPSATSSSIVHSTATTSAGARLGGAGSGVVIPEYSTPVPPVGGSGEIVSPILRRKETVEKSEREEHPESTTTDQTTSARTGGDQASQGGSFGQVPRLSISFEEPIAGGGRSPPLPGGRSPPLPAFREGRASPPGSPSTIHVDRLARGQGQPTTSGGEADLLPFSSSPPPLPAAGRPSSRQKQEHQTLEQELMDDERTETAPSELQLPLSLKSLPFIAAPVGELRKAQPITSGFDRLDRSIMQLVDRLPRSAPLQEKFDVIAKWIESYHVDVVPHRIAKQLSLILAIGNAPTSEEGNQTGAAAAVMRRESSFLPEPSLHRSSSVIEKRGKNGQIHPMAAISSCFALHQLLLVLSRTNPIMGPIVDTVFSGILSLIYVDPPVAIGPTLVDVAVAHDEFKQYLKPFNGPMHFQQAAEQGKKLRAVQRFAVQNDLVRKNNRDVINAMGRRGNTFSLRAMLRGWRQVVIQTKNAKAQAKVLSNVEAKLAAARQEAKDLSEQLTKKQQDYAALEDEFRTHREEADIQLKALQYDTIQLRHEVENFEKNQGGLRAALAESSSRVVTVEDEWRSRYNDLIEKVRSFSQDRFCLAPHLQRHLPLNSHSTDTSSSTSPTSPQKQQQQQQQVVFGEHWILNWVKDVLRTNPDSPWTTNRESLIAREASGAPKPHEIPKLTSILGGNACLDNVAALLHVLLPKHLTMDELERKYLEVPGPEKATQLLQWFRDKGLPLPAGLYDDDLISTGPEGTAAMTQLFTRIVRFVASPFAEAVLSDSKLKTEMMDAPRRHDAPNAPKLSVAATKPQPDHDADAAEEDKENATSENTAVDTKDEEEESATLEAGASVAVNTTISPSKVLAELKEWEATQLKYDAIASQARDFGITSVMTALSASTSRSGHAQQLTTEESNDQGLFMLSYHHLSEHCTRPEHEVISQLMTKHYLVLRAIFLTYAAAPSMKNASLSRTQLMRLFTDSKIGSAAKVNRKAVLGVIPAVASYDIKKTLASMVGVAKLAFSETTPSVAECFRLFIEQHLRPFCAYLDKRSMLSHTRENRQMAMLLEENRNDLFKIFRGFCSDASPNRMEESRFLRLMKAVFVLRQTAAAGGTEVQTPQPEDATDDAVKKDDAGEGEEEEEVLPPLAAHYLVTLSEEQVRTAFTLSKVGPADVSVNFDSFLTAVCICSYMAFPFPWIQLGCSSHKFITQHLLQPLASRFHLAFKMPFEKQR